MPIPLIIIAVIAIGTLLTAGALYKWWDNILILLKGKKLSILGGIETGKTTMHTFLREGALRVDHIATAKEKVKANRFELKDLRLDLKEGIDISGLEDFRKDWKRRFLESDICIYMFNASKVYGGDVEYQKRIETHLAHIGEWKKELKNNINVIVVGTFCDLIAEYASLTESNKQYFEQKIRQGIKSAYSKVDLSASRVIIGSMVNQDEAEKLVYNLLRQLQLSEL